MMNNSTFYKFAIFFVLICFVTTLSIAQTSYPVKYLDNPSPGYLLIGPQTGGYVSLHDNSGNPVYSKNITGYGGSPNALRVLDNGNLAFYTANKWIIMDRYFNIINQFKATSPYSTDFHTIRSGPNGNYVLAADEIIVVDMSALVPNGFTKASVLNNIIQEFDQNKNLVFQWNCYEHIAITDATIDQNLTVPDIDPYHINSVYYDSDGNLLANFRNLDALIKINRATGDIMWIMGGSKSKRNQFTFINDTENGFYGFSHQHDPKRLPNGNILLFDNGNLKPAKFSRAVEYRINESSKTATKVWEYRYPTTVFAQFQGNAQRLPNGNTIIGWGCNTTQNLATEVTSDGKMVLDMALGNNMHSYQVLRNVVMMNTVTQHISNTQTYYFNDYCNYTGVTLNVSSLTGSGDASIEKHSYAPHNLSYNSVQPCTYLPYRWVFNNRGITKLNARLFIDLNYLYYDKDKNNLKIFWRNSEISGPFTMLETTYNERSNCLEADIEGSGEYFIGCIYNETPTLVSPFNNSTNQPLNTILSWSSKSQSKNFILQVSLTNKFESMVYEKNLEETERIVCDFLKNNTTYYWRVKGNSDACDIKWSDIYSFSTEIAQPNLLKPANKSNNQPLTGILTWDTVSGATSYKIQISENPCLIPLLICQTNSDSTNFIYSNLKPLTQYYWRVSASNNDTYGKWTNINSFTTSLGNVTLITPLNMDQRLLTKGLLKWSSINSIDRYCVQLSNNLNFQNIIIDTIVYKKTELEYSKLLNSSTYYWRVKGLYHDTCTNWSATWKFNTVIGQPLLSYPENDSKDHPIKGTLEWLNMDAAESYQLQISSNSDFNFTVFDSTVHSSQFYYNNLYFLTQYYWRVRASDGQEYGDWSDTRSFITLAEQLYPKNEEFKIPNDVILEWNESDNVEYYEVKIATDLSFKNNRKAYYYIKSNKHLIENLKFNTSYYWSIRSFKSGQFTQWSEPFIFTTRLSTPVLLSPIDIKIENSANLVFNWKLSEEAEFYRIQIAKDTSFNNIIFENDKITNELYSPNEILPDALYYWRVEAINNKNSSDWSEIKSFNVISFSGVDNRESLSNFNFYPNPVKDNITFDFFVDTPSAIQFQVIDVLGKTVRTISRNYFQTGNTSIVWDCKDDNGNYCPSGSYRMVILGRTINKSCQFLILE